MQHVFGELVELPKRGEAILHSANVVCDLTRRVDLIAWNVCGPTYLHVVHGPSRAFQCTTVELVYVGVGVGVCALSTDE